jgi:hypothetical protein
MKKSINIKCSKLLLESSIKVGDVDYEKKLRKRVVDLRRAQDMASAAKKRAEDNGQSDIAQKLEDKIVELDDLLATYNVDTIDDEDTAAGASSDAKNKNGKDEDDDGFIASANILWVHVASGYQKEMQGKLEIADNDGDVKKEAKFTLTSLNGSSGTKGDLGAVVIKSASPNLDITVSDSTMTLQMVWEDFE